MAGYGQSLWYSDNQFNTKLRNLQQESKKNNKLAASHTTDTPTPHQYHGFDAFVQLFRTRSQHLGIKRWRKRSLVTATNLSLNTEIRIMHIMLKAIYCKCVLSIFAIGLAIVIQGAAAYTREIVNNKPPLQIRPSWLQTCKRSNPNENKCFRQLFEGCFPALAAGIPEIGVKSFEPLNIDQVSVSKGSGNLVLSGGFQNLVIRGPSNATVRRASLDLDRRHLNFELELPRLRIRAKYNLKGNILLLPLIGNGDVAMALKNVHTAVYTKISLRNETQTGDEIIHIDEMKVNFEVGAMRIHLKNLFNGNDILAASINTFLNQNGNEVIAELRPDLELGLADIFHGLWNNVFSKMPTKLWLV